MVFLWDRILEIPYHVILTSGSWEGPRRKQILLLTVSRPSDQSLLHCGVLSILPYVMPALHFSEAKVMNGFDFQTCRSYSSHFPSSDGQWRETWTWMAHTQLLKENQHGCRHMVLIKWWTKSLCLCKISQCGYMLIRLYPGEYTTRQFNLLAHGSSFGPEHILAQQMVLTWKRQHLSKLFFHWLNQVTSGILFTLPRPLWSKLAYCFLLSV